MINIMMVETDENKVNQMQRLVEASEEPWNFYSAATAEACLDLMENHWMDIVILDIDLPDWDGMELARQIRATNGYEFVWMILLSNHQIHESEAYRKIRCYDYVVKPYEVKEIFQTVEMLSRYKITAVGEEDQEYISFRQRDQYFKIMTRDILYIEVVGNNSALYTYTQSFCLRKMSLKKLKLMLPNYFVQCHKSFIVNRNYIESINKGPYGWEIRLKDYGHPIPNGDKYKDNVSLFA